MLLVSSPLLWGANLILEISTNAGLFFFLTYAAAVLITCSSFKISDLFDLKVSIPKDFALNKTSPLTVFFEGVVSAT